ncbi:hypothetical protein ACFLT5_01685 [Chloroflexota bacterium]
MPEENALSQLIRDRYPFPISHAYTYLESRVDPGDRYQALLTCFEVTLKTITSIGLANLMRDIQEDPALGNAGLFQELLDILGRPLSSGHWHQLLHLVLRPYALSLERLLMPEMFHFYYRVTEHGNVRTQRETVGIIQRFIQERNEEAHHRNRGQAAAVQRQIVVKELTADLTALLHALRFLAGYTILYVEHAEHHQGQWHYRANIATGNSYPFRQRTWQTELGISAHRCLLVNETRSKMLELTPFLIVTSEGRLQQPDLFIFDGIFSSGRANFMNYHVGDYVEATDESSPASIAGDVVNSLLSLLKSRIPLSAEGEPTTEDRLSADEIYRGAVRWTLEHGGEQSIPLDALRQILDLSREEALKQERELGQARGVEVEEEVEVPFEGVPSWANLAYYVLDGSGQEEMYYRTIAAAAEILKDQYDPEWEKGDSASVEATISQILSQDPRFFKLRRGYYRLTKANDLLSNPSWANLACFVLQRHDPKNRGMHLQEITDLAVKLKEKHSDWEQSKAQTPANTLSATMSMDHRFESMRKRGYWRLVAQEAPMESKPASTDTPLPSARDEAYEAVLARLQELGAVEPLPFGRTYYALDSRIHLMFRFSKAHHRNNEIEFFLGITPQYFERISALGHGFLVLVLGAPDNVLLVPVEIFAQWVQGLKTSGSGTWPMAFYQSSQQKNIERWVPGQGRDDVTVFQNDYAALRRILAQVGKPRSRRLAAPLRVHDLLEAGLLKPGDVVHTKKRPDLEATIVDSTFVEYAGKRWRYNDWGTHVTGWTAINIYRGFILARTGDTLDKLRRRLRSRPTS